MNVKDLSMRVVEGMQGYGLQLHTAWGYYCSALIPIIKWHEASNEQNFSREIITAYVRHVDERYESGDFSLSHYRTLKRGVELLTELHDTGKLDYTAPKKRSGFQLNDYYEDVLACFLNAGDFSPKGYSDATWIGRKYFSWLIQNGHEQLDGVGADEIQQFVIFCSHHMKPTSIHNVLLYMKKLYAFLLETNYAASNYTDLLSFTVSRESRLFPALPPSEIATILELINRRTPKGKRDYAIVLLGVVMGLRAVDIARVRLQDIDWRKGEIKIVQSKTDESLALPLTKDVGEAIRDYILNGRQETISDEVFLRHHPPFKGFSNGVAIGDMYDYYRKKTGLPRDAHDGKGFHALRRTLGKNLVTSGVPVTMVTQIFGDTHFNGTQKYIALDTEHLKECALSFVGIAPKGGAYYE